MASPVTPLPPEGHPRLAEYSRRGSDGLVGKGLKNRSRSAMIKLQVPSKNSPGASRKQYTPSTSDRYLNSFFFVNFFFSEFCSKSAKFNF